MRGVGTGWLGVVVAVGAASVGHGEEPPAAVDGQVMMYYVSPDGDDGQAGTASRPWASLHRAIEAVGPGDRVVVHGGTYAIDRPLLFAVRGEPDAWIEFTAADGEAVVIDAEAIRPTSGREASSMAAIDVTDAAYLRLKGLGVRNSYGFGIYVREPSRHVDVQDCTVDMTFAPGIAVRHAAYVRIVGCEVTRANTQKMRLFGNPERECPHEAISIMGGRHFEVAWNHVHHCEKEGIDVKEVSRHGVVHHNYIHDLPRQGLYVDAWFGLLEDVEVFSNVVHDCEWGMAICVEGRDSRLRHVRVHHNVFYRNRASGIYFGTWGHDGPREDVRITHNTLYANGTPRHWAGATGSIDVRSAGTRDTLIANNVCAGRGGFEIATWVEPQHAPARLAELGIRITHNLIDSFKNDADWPGEQDYGLPHPVRGEHLIIADPGFTDPHGNDFTLRPDSPAVAAGLPLNPGHTNAPPPDLGALPLGRSILPRSDSVMIEHGFEPYRPGRSLHPLLGP